MDHKTLEPKDDALDVGPAWRRWLARLLIALVFFFNVQCAVLFLLWPERFAPAYELAGEVGAAVVRGFGVLFLMWNVPYAVALWHPQRFRLALGEAVIMQAIGVLGETGILWALPPGHEVLHAAIGRFILFDALGLLSLCVALWLSVRRPSTARRGDYAGRFS